MLRRLRFPIAVVLAAGLLGACSDDGDDGAGGATTTSTGPGSTVKATTTEVEATDFSFSPKTVSVEAGTPVAVRLANKGTAAHTFTVDELDIDQELSAGEEVEVLVQAPEAATYTFYCRFHRAAGMEGTLTAT